MNHIYRIVWNQVLNAWVAVAESACGRGKGSSRTLVAAALSLTASFAQAAPAGGQVVSGAGNIAQSGNTTTITQTSQNLSLNWQSFNIARQETVNFVQPSASAIAVNRIFDTNGSQILGQLNANGQVYLVNPNGILFGQGAQVNVGGLVASTLDVTDASVNSAMRTFSGTGTGSIVNQGTLHAASGGYVALLGNTVSNQGTITAPQGTVALGAGNAVTLNFNGNSLVKMQVDQSVLNSLAENGGLIQADGGMVRMSAGAKDTLLASVVNNTGVIEARTVENHEGSIVLLGGMAAGTTNVGGTLDASAPNGGNGGFIETSAAEVNIANDSVVTTLATAGKTGLWLIDPVNFTITAGSGSQTTSGIGATTLANSLNATDVTIQTDGSTAGLGNISVNASVTKTAVGTTSLTLKAHGDIIFANNVAVKTTGGALNVTLNSDSDSNLSGAIRLNNSASIVTKGGNIIMGGGSDPTTMAAYGSAANPDGIRLINNSTGAILDAGGGNISLIGHSEATNAGGVTANVNAQIKTTGNGTITIIGNGGASGYGVGLDRTSISTQNGAINITGTAGAPSVSGGNSYSVVQRVGYKIESTGSGAINVTGIGGDGMYLGAWGAATVVGGNSATGNITLTADKLVISDADYTFKSTGRLTIKPFTAGTTIGIADGAGTLALAASYFSTNFVNGFSGITVGNTSAGNVTIGGTTTTPDSLTVLTGGNITINAAASLGSSQAAGTLALAAGGNFINNGGANALRTTDGGVTDRWVVYSSTPAGDTFGGLLSDNKAVWGQNATSLAPASVASGNRYVFNTGTVTATTTSANKTQGETANLSGNVTYSGLMLSSAATYGNVYQDVVIGDVLSTLPTISSVGASASATVAGGPYAITASGAVANAGYGISYANTGMLSVTGGTPPETVRNATTQLASNIFSPQAATQPRAILNTTMAIGSAGPALQIVNGGIRLPGTLVTANE